MATEQSILENKLNKAIASFIRQEIKKFHFGTKSVITYEGFLSNKMLIIEAIKAGIPYSLFDLIKHYTTFTENEWAGFLDISTKSLQRYRDTTGHYFKSLQSEKIIEMAEVTKTGLDVFGDREKLKLWLNTPNFALGNLKPIELLKDSYGKELVMGELTRVSHGILV